MLDPNLFRSSYPTLESRKHKVFISYHEADKDEVDAFVRTFDHNHDVFISRFLDMAQNVIDSTDTDYVMKRIRELYLKDSTVTIVLIGKCTRSRRYVDWEIQSSLRSGGTITPNGLLGVKLNSYNKNGYPDRLNLNLKQNDQQKDCYARVMDYPTSISTLTSYIEDAFQARTSRRQWIDNPRERLEYNRKCP
jgi:hypothetical protein